MNEKKHRLGFIEEKETIWDVYKEKFVCATHNGNSVYGVLSEINTHRNYANFMPSIIVQGDGSLTINTKLPTRTSLNFDLIRPFTQTIEDYVRDYNDNLKRDKLTKIQTTQLK